MKLKKAQFKHLILSLALLLAIGLTTFVYAVELPLQNGGFESGSMNPWTSHFGTASVVTEDQHSGSYSLKMEDHGRVTQSDLDIPSGDTHIAWEAYVKTTNRVHVYGGICKNTNCAHFYYGTCEGFIEPQPYAIAESVSDWTAISTTLELPPGYVCAYMAFDNVNKGTVSYFDDARVYTFTPADSVSVNIAKSVSPSSAKPGEAITYTIGFSNTGAITATDVIITDVLSANIVNPAWDSSGVTLTPIGGQTYAWTAPDLAQGEGGVITITGVLTKPLAAGTLPNTVTLAVSGTVKTDSADLTVLNVAPVANAGVDQSVSLSDTVTLDGSGTDDNGDTLTYGWAQTGDPDVTLSSASAPAPTFTAPSTAGVLTFTLTVTDTGSLTDTDEVIITASAGTPGYASTPEADSTINVGSVKVSSSLTATLIISETGNATLNITDLALSGPNAADFSVSPTSFSIVDGGAPQTVSITCTPASYGLRTATLTVNHNATGSPATYTLNCTGQTMIYLPLVVCNTP